MSKIKKTAPEILVSAKCLMSLSGHLLRPAGIGPLRLLVFHKIHCGAVSTEKRQVPDPCCQSVSLVLITLSNK